MSLQEARTLRLREPPELHGELSPDTRLRGTSCRCARFPSCAIPVSTFTRAHVDRYACVLRDLQQSTFSPSSISRFFVVFPTSRLAGWEPERASLPRVCSSDVTDVVGRQQ